MVLTLLVPNPASPTVAMEDDLRRLVQILEGTPKLIDDRSIDPTNEADVRREVYGLLLHVFPDTVREIPLPKAVKTYKPDLGIPRLKVAIEYKYATSEAEAKIIVGGIFEDIHAYSGSSDWTTFIAVLYMTQQFFTRAQIEADWARSKVPGNWKPIVVYGRGGKKAKAK